MDRIKIPQEWVLPLEKIAFGVHGLRIGFVNIFAIDHDNGSWTLLDSGLPFSDGVIRRWVEKYFKVPPTAIILSHGHFDHVSSARALADHWNLPIYAHEGETPYLTGQRQYPPPNLGAGGGLMTLLSPLLPRGPVNLGNRLRKFPPTEELGRSTLLPGWSIIHTPGHTSGHVSFFRADDRTLLPGDAFCTTKPESFFEAAVAQKPELHGPPSYFTSDWLHAKESVRKLAELNPLTVAPGHGRPIRGSDVSTALHALASTFDKVAIPENRKSIAS